jgi:thioredoxin 1
MNRRAFLNLTMAVSLATPLVAAVAAGATSVDYMPGLVKDRLAKGETLFLDFFAPWCPTCIAQDRVIDALRAADPAYDKAVTFVHIDWDTYETDQLTKDLNIPRRSTLVVLKGDKELGRIVAGTGKDEIKALLDTALGAASS